MSFRLLIPLLTHPSQWRAVSKVTEQQDGKWYTLGSRCIEIYCGAKLMQEGCDFGNREPVLAGEGIVTWVSPAEVERRVYF